VSHTYQSESLPPPTSGDERGPIPRSELTVLKVVREDGVSFAECPHCGRRTRFGQVTGKTIHAPRDIAELLVNEMSALEREELRVAILNARNSVLAVETVYQGNVSSSLVRVGELFCEAVRRQATGILICHNHPSGDPTPSPDDLRLTAEALAAGRLLDIALLDHVVIGGGTWVSLRDRGVAFDSPGDHRGGEIAWTRS
jgi:DNA repair protein RadC